jgi:hypothetical protein
LAFASLARVLSIKGKGYQPLQVSLFSLRKLIQNCKDLLAFLKNKTKDIKGD